MNLFKQDHLVAMIAAPIVWAMHFLVLYILVSLACGFGWARADRFGLGPAEWGIVVATAAALAVIGYVAAVNFAKYRRVRAMSDAPRASTSGFIALTAVLLCMLSVVAVVWAALPVLLLPTCVQ